VQRQTNRAERGFDLFAQRLNQWPQRRVGVLPQLVFGDAGRVCQIEVERQFVDSQEVGGDSSGVPRDGARPIRAGGKVAIFFKDLVFDFR